MALSVKNSSLEVIGQHFGDIFCLQFQGVSPPSHITGTAHFVRWVSSHLQVK